MRQRVTHLPIVSDPSPAFWRPWVDHGFASVAAGADGIMLEVHPDQNQL